MTANLNPSISFRMPLSLKKENDTFLHKAEGYVQVTDNFFLVWT